MSCSLATASSLYQELRKKQKPKRKPMLYTYTEHHFVLGGNLPWNLHKSRMI